MPEYLVAPKLPDRFSIGKLEANLAAPSKHQPKLVRRISWPVNSSHTVFGDNGKVGYRLHSSEYELSLSEDQLKTIFSEVGKDRDIFVFGVGLGEQVDFILDRFPDKKIMAWDRDPWLVRLFLMQKDYSKYLASGNLKLFMCADLIHLIRRIKELDVVYHPLLKAVYHNEAELIMSGVGNRRILVNTGGLFVDDVAQSLKDFGYTTFYLDLNGISMEEIEYAIIQFMPSIIFSVNYQNGLSELCKKFSLTLLCWEIDPSIDVLGPLSVKNEKAHIFTYRKKNQDEFLSAGFDNVQFLALASNVKNRKPMILSEEEEENYTSPISFVGSSMMRQAQNYRGILTDLYREYRNFDSKASLEAEELFRRILEIQSRDYSTFRIPELTQELLGNFLEYVYQKNGQKLDPIILLAESAAAEKRLAYLSRLGRFGVKVWGDEGLKMTENSGAKYMGLAGHTYEINKIYSASLINVDISRNYQMDMVNMRVFDIMACGGFVLAEYSEDLEELFDLGREVIAYRNSDELSEKTEYYLLHSEEAKEIAHKGMMAVRERHTIKKRVEYMLGFIGGKG